MTISKAVRYDGAKIYNGGDMNYFNGAIKADSKFNFVSGGNQAKIDGKLSTQKVEKNIPPIYIEHFDFVSNVYDKA